MIQYFSDWAERFYGACVVCGVVFAMPNRDETLPSTLTPSSDWLFDVIVIDIDEL